MNSIELLLDHHFLKLLYYNIVLSNIIDSSIIMIKKLSQYDNYSSLVQLLAAHTINYLVKENYPRPSKQWC